MVSGDEWSIGIYIGDTLLGVAPMVDGISSPDGEYNPGDLFVIQRMVLGLH